METYIELGSMAHEYKHCTRFFARSKLTINAIRYMHADFYDLPDDTRYSASADSPNQKFKLLEEVTFDDSEQSQQTISLILILEGTDTQCINQTALLTSDKKESPDWVTGLEGGPSLAKM
jgi:hypothetical protein